MRIQLTLKTDKPLSIRFNYQYPLSSALYRILSLSSPVYADFLHERGYLGPDGNPRKLFTFSKLIFTPPARPDGGFLRIPQECSARLVVSSPMLEDFIRNFVTGLFERQIIELPGSDGFVPLMIECIETMPEPEFKETCRFRTLSPVVLTTMKDTDRGPVTYYYRPTDKGIAEAVRRSLIGKYETVHGKKPIDDRLVFEVDVDYIKRRGGQERVSKLIHLREGGPDETRVKAFEAPFILSGSKELMKTAWDCGLGDKCSMGFGCVDVDWNRR